MLQLQDYLYLQYKLDKWNHAYHIANLIGH